MSLELFIEVYVNASEEQKALIRAILTYLEARPSSPAADC